MVKIAPSLLSADFSNLHAQVKQLEKGGADMIHIDVMDGHFVPNITIGPVVIKSVRSATKLPLDVHLMIEKADYYAEAFCEAGADILTVHVEATNHLHRLVQKIKSLNLKVGVSLNPSTPAIALREILSDIDMVLVMSVNPGFGGQKFIHSAVRKIQEISLMIEVLGKKKIDIEVDGGISEKNVGQVVTAGANVIVAGNSIFSQNNLPKAVQNLRKEADRYCKK